ncbi:acyl-CoA dehydrogenase family protein [Microlunatus sp. GCM10028923]|uniref:acyl-CoA dehydrogenase family protein n=1 Tax=Microlunatus sp. GCM10028923 TaxID=3273400 RepID=UPI00360A4F97
MAASPFAVPVEEQRWIEAVTELAPGFAARAAEHDEQASLPVDNLTALQAAGVDVAALPVEHGGGGLSYQSLGEILRIVGRACPSTACIWLMHIGAALTLVRYTAPDRSAFYAGEVTAGRRFANALSEPTGGNLFLMPLQRAEPVEGGHRLDGAKRFVSGCEIADHFLVNALLDDGPAFFGVPADDSIEGVPIWDAMGLRGTRSQLLNFGGTVLREENRCVRMVRGEPNIIALGLGWLSIGVAEAALDALVEHARTRVLPTTGAPLAELQWVTFDTADARAELTAARLLCERTMWLADHGEPGAMESAVEAKLYANQVAKRVADLALRIGGGSGFLRTSPIQRHFRDAQAGALMAYSVEVCRDLVGRRVLGP